MSSMHLNNFYSKSFRTSTLSLNKIFICILYDLVELQAISTLLLKIPRSKNAFKIVKHCSCLLHRYLTTFPTVSASVFYSSVNSPIINPVTWINELNSVSPHIKPSPYLLSRTGMNPLFPISLSLP